MQGAALASVWFGLSSATRGEPVSTPASPDPTIESLAAEVKKARANALMAALAQLDKASATPKSAEDFFFDCVKRLDFKRDLEEAGKFEEWKRGFLAQWTGHSLGLVLQFQLRYQALVIRSAGASDPASVVPAWLAFVESLAQHPAEAAYGASFLAQPVTSSVFNKALKLRQLAGADGFAVSPLDIAGIFERQILPHVKPENLAGAWQRRIDLQGQFAKGTLLPSEYDEYLSFELPRLQWRQIVEVRFRDSPVDPAAFRDAAQFIRQHAQHPDAEQWVAKLRSLR